MANDIFDKPFSLVGDATPEKMYQIDAMFEDIYRRLASTQQTVVQAFPEGQPVDVTRWKTGPWTYDGIVPSARVARLVHNLAAATEYADFAPEGIDTCVEIAVTPLGAGASISGIRHFGQISRKICIVNASGTESLTIPHEEATSTDIYRFNLPDSTDIVLAPYQVLWASYNPELHRWQLMVTPHSSGGLSGGGGVALYASRTFLEAELEAMTGATFCEVIPAIANTCIVPLDVVWDNDVTDAYTNAPTWVVHRNGGGGNGLITPLSLTYSTGPRRQVYRSAMVAGSDPLADFSGTNVGCTLAAALTGVGAATTTVHIWYGTFSTV